MIKYLIKTGESLTLELNVLEENIGMMDDVLTISAALKKSSGNGTVPTRATPKVMDFAVAETSTGWEFTLTPEQTETIAPGMYVMDARMTFAGDQVVITDPVQIEIKGSVT